MNHGNTPFKRTINMKCRQENDCRPSGHGPGELSPDPDQAEEGEKMLKLKAAGDCSMFIMDSLTW